MLLLIWLTVCIKSTTHAFLAPSHIPSVSNRHQVVLGSQSDSSSASDTSPSTTTTSLKIDLLALAASYDRGFGATPAARSKVDDLIQQLSALNPTTNASLGIGDSTFNSFEEQPPIQGCWRMVWTTALDVLSLAASPISTVSAIYQDIQPPNRAINIIDLIPRPQAALPPGFLPTLVRAKVITSTQRRNDNRIGLIFERAEIRPLQILGVEIPLDAKFIPDVGIDFPNVSMLGGSNSEDSPGYFDVLYLDEDMLVIAQNEPGGVFVSVKADNTDPFL